MEETVKTHGWDGGWFLRAYDAFGNKVGSKACEEGRVFIESNGMCVMAGIGLQDSRAEQALAAVNEHLATPHGIVLQQPAYARYYVHLGEISSYPPGYKENAGIFCHTNPWIMIAETLVGHADLAFDYYSRINPSKREAISEVHRCEPYVYAQMIAGKDAATHGEAKNRLADRHGGVELRGDYAVHSGDSAHAERIEDRARHPNRLARFQCHAGVSQRHVSHPGGARREGQCRGAESGRKSSGRQRGAAACRRHKRSEGRRCGRLDKDCAGGHAQPLPQTTSSTSRSRAAGARGMSRAQLRRALPVDRSRAGRQDHAARHR